MTGVQTCALPICLFHQLFNQGRALLNRFLYRLHSIPSSIIPKAKGEVQGRRPVVNERKTRRERHVRKRTKGEALLGGIQGKAYGEFEFYSVAFTWGNVDEVGDNNHGVVFYGLKNKTI